jgi:hypothetical protein
MAAANNGFDRELPSVDGWMAYASSRVPLKIWLREEGDAGAVVALSQVNVAHALVGHGEADEVRLPSGARAARLVPDHASLHRLLRRAFQLSKTLPDELLREFEKATASLPRTTEVERLVVQRVGQDVFRAGLIEYWDGCCAVTGLAVLELLRASHIKPWADCETDAERLDVFNGLLLAPHLDATFDAGFITVGSDGSIVVSAALSSEDRAALGLAAPLRVPGLAGGHEPYLRWHRAHVFESSLPGAR